MMAITSVMAASLWMIATADGLTVLQSKKGDPKPSELVYRHLQRQVHAAMDRRRKRVNQLENPAQIRAYQKRMRAFFIKQLGGFPRRSPLNAKVVGKLDDDGFRIEKVIFDSQPNHRITATLYLPKSKGPWPAVVVASGHSRTGRMAGYNQRFGIIMAKHGMAALCYDPIGQGERSQMLGKDGKPKHRSTTTEHFQIGVGSILVGRNTARYRVWDGMRCIDYLASRKDINAKRIGFTGCSGGGTLTSYVMALDDRVTCAAPACYLTTFRNLVDTIGPQDAEQNIFGQLAFGMDHPDYVLMRAPRPTLISATTKDFFDISGTWDNYRQCKRIYTKLGFPERVALVEGTGGHGVPMSNLNAIARWMGRWLLDKDEHFAETKLPTRPVKDLLCTQKGQVLLSPGELSVFQLNAKYESQLKSNRDAARKRKALSGGELRNRVRQLAGIRHLKELKEPTVKTAGTLKRSGYTIEKLVLERSDGVPLPTLRFTPAKATGDVYLYLHGEGKQADANPGGAIENLVKRGNTVVAVDLSGLGETRRSGGQLGDWKNFYMAYLLGKSYVGIRAEDVLVATRFAAASEEAKSRRIKLVAIGEAAIPALHVAAVEPRLFSTVQLRRMVPSWRPVVTATESHNQLVNTVHGALEVYDLPDLISLAGGKSVTIEQPAGVNDK